MKTPNRAPVGALAGVFLAFGVRTAAAAASADYRFHGETLNACGGASFSVSYATLGGASDMEARTQTARGVTNRPGPTGVFAAPLFDAADLAVGLDAEPSVAGEGIEMQYCMTVTNRGPDPASDVTLECLLPAVARAMSASTSQGTWSADARRVAWRVGTVPPAGVARMNLSVLAESPAACATATAAAVGRITDLNSADNAAEAVTRVAPTRDVSTDTTVAGDDFVTIEGRYVLVRSDATLSVQGAHRAAALTVAGALTHARGEADGVRLLLDGRLEVLSGGRIDVSGKGFRGAGRDGLALGPGETRGVAGAATTVGGATERSGGSYGSLGADAGGGRANGPYGSESAPTDLGSGGGASGPSGLHGGNGGGRVDIQAADIRIDGAIRANGDAGFGGGGGSGGSIWLRLMGGEFGGRGTVEAAGGAAENGGAGGGGRVAVHGYGTNRFVGVIGGQGTVNLTVGGSRDTDGDGMPDAFEVAHRLDPYDGTDARIDSDGDGSPNAHEFLARTAPRDPDSVFRLTGVRRSEAEFTLDFLSAPGVCYVVEWRGSLITGAWNAAVATVFTGHGGASAAVPVRGTNRTGYYRLRLE